MNARRAQVTGPPQLLIWVTEIDIFLFVKFHPHNLYIFQLCHHFEMTPKNKISKEEKKIQTLEEICENTRAIRRVVNRILDHMHEYCDRYEDVDYDPNTIGWKDLDDYDDMYL